MKNPASDVLVVGAGPVGLMLAGELVRRGCTTRIIEVLAERSSFVKALGITPRTLEVFDQVGVLDAALDRGEISEAMCTSVNGKLVSRGLTRSSKWPYDFMSLCQPDTEAILEERFHDAGGSIERGSKLVSLVDHGDSVEAAIEHSTGDLEQATFRWLVGCDGAHSTVRKQLDIPFEGEKYELTFLVADVELDWGRNHGEGWKIVLLDASGAIENMAAAIPIPGNDRRYRISTVVAAGDPAEMPAFPEHPDLAFTREVFEPLLPGVAIDALRWSSIYGVSHRLAGTYHLGNVFLAGDAAHIHPPIGGLGMNTGLQDAFNLGWKLDLARRGHAGKRLLDSYNEERHAVGEDVVRSTTRRMDNAIEQREEDEQTEIDAGTQLYISYRGSSISAASCGDAGLQPGDRLPSCDGLTSPGIQGTYQLVDLLKDGRHRLLGWPGQAAWSIERLLEMDGILRARLGDGVGTTCIAPSLDSPDPQSPFPLVIDSDGGFADAFGPGAMVLLVRPDGHVSWMGPWDDSGVESLSAHLDLVLG